MALSSGIGFAVSGFVPLLGQRYRKGEGGSGITKGGDGCLKCSPRLLEIEPAADEASPIICKLHKAWFDSSGPCALAATIAPPEASLHHSRPGVYDMTPVHTSQ